MNHFKVFLTQCPNQVYIFYEDLIRLLLGGPCFEVQLHIQCYPPVVQQQAWNSSRVSESLPYLPLQSSLSQDEFDVSNTATRPFSVIQYGRKNGYHAHNQTTEAQVSYTLEMKNFEWAVFSSVMQALVETITFLSCFLPTASVFSTYC